MNARTILAPLALTVAILAGGPSWGTTPAPTGSSALEALQDAYTRSVTQGDDAVRFRDLLATLLQRLKRSSATTVDVDALAQDATRALQLLAPSAGDPEQVFRTVVNAATASMRSIDPYFRYIDARAYGHERDESPAGFGGLGLQVESSSGGVRIVSVMPDSPAERANALAPGDLIVRVDAEPLAGMPLTDAIARMRGQPGTPVSITVQRSGQDAEITVALKRDTIRRQLLRTSLEGDVLVLRLAAFGPSVAASIEQAIAAAATPPKALVLDLRGNPGGLLLEAVKLADAFLNAGEIVSLRRQESSRSRAWQSNPAELLPGVPMVVLIDRRSASASELVADALQHHGRATVMGQRSFGKGSVQTTLPLGPDAGAIKLTTAIYHGPSGHTVQRIGVAPDIELVAMSGPDTSTSRGRSDDAARAADAAAPRKARARIDPARCAGAPATDPALACAFDFFRSGGFDAFVARLGEVAP